MFSKRIKKKNRTLTRQNSTFSVLRLLEVTAARLYSKYTLLKRLQNKPETMLAHHHTVALKNSLREPIRLHINGESLI
jgi:hypothetical protein